MNAVEALRERVDRLPRISLDGRLLVPLVDVLALVEDVLKLAREV